MFIVWKKANIFIVILIISFAIITCTIWDEVSLPTTADPEEKAFIIIDAGHGGEDGGAVGVSGVLEKDLNLAVAAKVKELLEAESIPVIMTREEDIALSDMSKKTISARKKSDMQNRLKLVREAGTKMYVGIHMNTFTDPKYKGVQVFYSGNNPESKVLGEKMQAVIKRNIDDGNTRKAKKAGNDIYLMKNITAPAIIVECGMLSNPEEEELLRTPEYQQKMAESIVMGIKEYLTASPM